MAVTTVEPSIKDPPRRGHNRNDFSIKDRSKSQMYIFQNYS